MSCLTIHRRGLWYSPSIGRAPGHGQAHELRGATMTTTVARFALVAGLPWPAYPDRDATLVRAGANGSGDGDRLQVELLRASERRKLGGAADLLRGLARG